MVMQHAVHVVLAEQVGLAAFILYLTCCIYNAKQPTMLNIGSWSYYAELVSYAEQAQSMCPNALLVLPMRSLAAHTASAFYLTMRYSTCYILHESIGIAAVIAFRWSHTSGVITLLTTLCLFDCHCMPRPFGYR